MLSDFLQDRAQKALNELDRMDPDVLLCENLDVVVAQLLARHMPDPIAIDWDGATAEPIAETTVQVTDPFFDRISTVRASRLVIAYPATGTTMMLNYQASTYSLSDMPAKVTNDGIVVEVIERQLDADAVKAHTQRVSESIDNRVEWANADLERFRTDCERDLRASAQRRADRIRNDRQVQAALGIPVKSTNQPRPPAVAAQRRHVPLNARHTQAEFVPEPVIEDAIYQDVLGIVTAWANSMERAPATAAKLDEEALRDLLLATLNGYWQGQAGGELFNGAGKTDVLIREGDRNVFIAECKIWRGPKAVASALDQLLSYLVWRDSKAALIVFIKSNNPQPLIEKLHDAVQDHPHHLLAKEAQDPSRRADYVFDSDQDGRRVSLAVLPVVIRG